MFTPDRPRAAMKRILALTVAAGLTISACSNSDDDDSSDTASVSTAAPATTETPATTDAPDATETPATTDAPSDTTSESSTDTTAPSEEPAEAAGPELGEFVAIEGVPGVSDEQIGVGVVGTGPSNPLGYCLLQCWKEGVQAYFDYRNDLGGVHGRELVIAEERDDKLNENQVETLALIESPDVFAIFSAPVIPAGFPDAAAAGVPLYSTVPSSFAAEGLDSIFITTGTTCLTCRNPGYVQAALLADATKVATLGYGIAQASKDCVAAQADTIGTWGSAVGLELAYRNDTLAFGLPNGIAPEVTAMKDAGVEFILTCLDQNGALTLEQELERQGMGDVLLALPQGYSTQFAADNASLIEGDIVTAFYHPFEADPIPALETFSTWTDGLAEINDFTVEGWIAADQLVTGLLAAGPEFDRESMVSAMNQITDYTADGLIPPVDWTKAHTPPTVDDPVTNAQELRCGAAVFVRGGSFELAGDPAAPFACFPGDMTEWTDPVAMSFG